MRDSVIKLIPDKLADKKDEVTALGMHLMLTQGMSDKDAMIAAINFFDVFDGFVEAVWMITNIAGPINYQYTTKLNHTVEFAVTPK